MLRGEDRHCADCGTVTIFLPVGDSPLTEEWVCTACDAGVALPGRAA